MLSGITALPSTPPSWLASASALVPLLKGKQRRVLELLIEGNGSQPISSIAFDRQIGWMPPYRDAVNGIIRQLNAKFTDVKVTQFDNELRLSRRRRSRVSAN